LHGKSEDESFRSQDIHIFLGRLNVSNHNEFGSVTRGVNEMIIHENWNTQSHNFTFDIAILTLSETVEFSESIRRICMPAEDEVLQSKGTIVGWGKSNNNRKHEVIPRFLEVNIISGSECPYAFPDLLRMGSQTKTFCAGTESSKIFIKYIC